MLDQLARHMYLRLGRRYKLVFIATQEPAALVITIGTVVLPPPMSIGGELSAAAPRKSEES